MRCPSKINKQDIALRKLGLRVRRKNLDVILK